MQTNYSSYNYSNSRDRIDEILNDISYSFEEVNYIPNRDKLTFSNGYYVNCSALAIDIRDSSSLPQNHKRPVLAKIYRAYISEVVAVMNGNINCKEINIIGDGILGIYDTPQKTDIDSVFNSAYTISSIIDVLNCKFSKLTISNINIGIGIDYGRALMIKAGYKGSSINDVVWMGDVVNSAVHLSSYGNKTYYDCEIMVSNVIFNNLNDHNKSLLTYSNNRGCYHGNVINTTMSEWLNENCQ